MADMQIPIAHLHVEEVSEGVFDEAMRHSITKISHLHFTTAAVPSMYAFDGVHALDFPTSVKKIVMMETLSETEFAPGTIEDRFIPNMFVDITDFIDLKIEIMKHYKTEIGQYPFPRSEKNIRALATFRGATAGCEYAESFMILKEIN